MRVEPVLEAKPGGTQKGLSQRGFQGTCGVWGLTGASAELKGPLGARVSSGRPDRFVLPRPPDLVDS